MFSSFQAPRAWGRGLFVGETDANGDEVPVYPSYTQFGLDVTNPVSVPATGSNVYTVDSDGNALQTGTLNGPTRSSADGISTLYFDGGDDIRFDPFEFTGQVSFNYWVKLETKTNIHTLFSNTWANLQSDGFKVCVNTWTTNDGSINMEIGNGVDGSAVRTAAGDIVPRDGTEWAMCTYALSFADSVNRFWVNGVEYPTINTSVPDPQTSSQWWVGQMAGSSYGMLGHLSQMQFWGGLLTNAEVQTIYNDTKSRYPGH